DRNPMKLPSIRLFYFSVAALWILAVLYARGTAPVQGAPDIAPVAQAPPAVVAPDTFVATADSAGITAIHAGSWDEYSEVRDFTDGYLAMGHAWGDYDNDGWVDLYITGGQGASTLYHNLGDSPMPAMANEADAQLATAWFELYPHLIETTDGFTPPVAARAIGYGGITLYEALVHGLPGYQSLVGQLNGLSALPTPQSDQRYHWPTVANSAMSTITRMLFSNTGAANQKAIALLELQFAEAYRPLLDAATFNRSVQYGRALAVAIYGWSVTDGGHEGQLRNFPEAYVLPAGEGLWETTPPAHATALQPEWGRNRPMALRLDHPCVAAPPTPYSEEPGSAFYALAQEVYDTVRLLTPQQRIIARFWADDPGTTPTPPGHSLMVTTQLLQQNHAPLALAAETYARVGIAVNDAFIGCWQTKYQYNRIRPITFIHDHIDAT
ncbi:MAG: hypothetical protein KDE53_09485, partial [Caldilineaceae bacterium]|nr:hypothetical protein [Caldilineaceae bacterium]